MNYCPACKVEVKDEWELCPLCQTPLKEDLGKIEEETTFLNPPLKFDRVNVLHGFTAFSFVIILAYFIIQFFWPFQFFGLEYILFGLMITWMMIIILLRKRRNIVKGIIYILILFSLLSVYFDYSNAGVGWSITFNIPILCLSAIIAMFTSLRFVNLKVGDYILYLQLTAIVGTVPLVFLLLDWVGHPLPSIISASVSIVLFFYLFIKHYQKIKDELKKRLHV